MSDDFGTGAMEQEFIQPMKALAVLINMTLNDKTEPGDIPKIGFLLIATPFGTGQGRGNFISNLKREAVLRLLKDQVASMEQAVEHQLVGNEVVAEKGGVVARCTCGWESGRRFSSMVASALFQEHQKSPAQNLYDVAREVCHAQGMAWTDPRTGETHQPPSDVT